MQARLDPARMTRYADDWHAAVDQIGDVLTELNRQVTTQLGETWRGHGADSALASVQQYVAASFDRLAACRSAAVHLTELSRAAGDLRACLGAPVTEDEALMQVRRLYSGPAVAAGNAVADIPEPPDPPPIGGPTTETVLPAGSPTTPAGAAPMSSAPPSPAPASVADNPARSGMRDAIGEPHPLWRAPTSNAGLSPPVSDALPARADLSATTPTPPPSGMPATVAGPSSSVAGRVSPSAPLTPFFGSPYPGLFGRDGNAEHRAPRYLVSAGNTTELIGELPLVAPPVIGE